MTQRFAEITFTDAVQAAQARYAPRAATPQRRNFASPSDVLGTREAAFIAERDSFYLASVGATGWPYIQHRGGPRGFLKVIDAKTLAFADFRGNRQYLTVGNTEGDDRVSLFLMDYANQRRLKLLGHLRSYELADADISLREAVALDGYRATIERVMTITIEAFDWNCPQHITPRFTERQIVAARE